MQTILEIQDFTKKYGKFIAVDQLSVKILPNEAVAFIGQNGAGKSSTMRAIAGMTTIDSGRISICDKDIVENPVEARQHLGYVPQDPTLPKHLTGNEFLSLVASIRGVPADQIEKTVDDFIKLCDLDKAQNKLIREYSGGMTRKIAMAASLIGTPELIILDESFVGMDPESTYKFEQYLKKYISEGHALLISSHILENLYNLCSRFIIIHHGKVIADHTLDELNQILESTSTHNLTSYYLHKTGQDELIQSFQK